MADQVDQNQFEILQRVVSQFPDGILLAFAYGSGVFKQVGNISPQNMIDFVFVVDNTHEWHSKNLSLYPSHYSILGKLGANVVGSIQDNYGAGVYYNTLVPFQGRMIKYGVINKENFERDMCSWRWLYTSGRLHKPVQIIHRKQGSSIRNFLEENLSHAVNAALLCLPEDFTEEELYMTISWLSYAGDFRMIFGEDKGKVKKIVHSNMQGFQELYSDVLSKGSNLSLLHGGRLQQDCSSKTTYSILQKLPSTLLKRVIVKASNNCKGSSDNLKEVANDRVKCGEYIRKGVGSIVLQSSVTQSSKGVITAGLSKTIVYSSLKIGKMLRGLVK